MEGAEGGKVKWKDCTSIGLYAQESEECTVDSRAHQLTCKAMEDEINHDKEIIQRENKTKTEMEAGTTYIRLGLRKKKQLTVVRRTFNYNISYENIKEFDMVRRCCNAASIP